MDAAIHFKVTDPHSQRFTLPSFLETLYPIHSGSKSSQLLPHSPRHKEQPDTKSPRHMLCWLAAQRTTAPLCANQASMGLIRSLAHSENGDLGMKYHFSPLATNAICPAQVIFWPRLQPTPPRASRKQMCVRSNRVSRILIADPRGYAHKVALMSYPDHTTAARWLPQRAKHGIHTFRVCTSRSHLGSSCSTHRTRGWRETPALAGHGVLSHLSHPAVLHLLRRCGGNHYYLARSTLWTQSNSDPSALSDPAPPDPPPSFRRTRDVPWSGALPRTRVDHRYSVQAGGTPRMDQDFTRCDARVRGDARRDCASRSSQVS